MHTTLPLPLPPGVKSMRNWWLWPLAPVPSARLWALTLNASAAPGWPATRPEPTTLSRGELAEVAAGTSMMPSAIRSASFVERIWVLPECVTATLCLWAGTYIRVRHWGEGRFHRDGSPGDRHEVRKAGRPTHLGNRRKAFRISSRIDSHRPDVVPGRSDPHDLVQDLEAAGDLS